MDKNLYKNVISIDPNNGTPSNFESLYVGYDNLIRSNFTKLGIPSQESDDAVQEVQLKFWLKGGMNFFDSTRGKHFSGMYRSWTSMFLLQERDKYVKYYSRHSPNDLNRDNEREIPDFSDELIEDAAIREWVVRAEQALADKPKLIPVLRKCVAAAEVGRTLTRADIVEVTGVKMTEATGMLKQLRLALIESGLGVESIRGY